MDVHLWVVNLLLDNKIAGLPRRAARLDVNDRCV